MTSPRGGGAAAVKRFFTTAMAGLSAVGLDCTLRSNGGTPDMVWAYLVPSATEHRTGTCTCDDRAM